MCVCVCVCVCVCLCVCVCFFSPLANWARAYNDQGKYVTRDPSTVKNNFQLASMNLLNLAIISTELFLEENIYDNEQMILTELKSILSRKLQKCISLSEYNHYEKKSLIPAKLDFSIFWSLKATKKSQ